MCNGVLQWAFLFIETECLNGFRGRYVMICVIRTTFVGPPSSLVYAVCRMECFSERWSPRNQAAICVFHSLMLLDDDPKGLMRRPPDCGHILGCKPCSDMGCQESLSNVPGRQRSMPSNVCSRSVAATKANLTANEKRLARGIERGCLFLSHTCASRLSLLPLFACPAE
jgi:hypothetical protein